ncbi:hypothetical protein ACC713_10960 [Rhizobium johnstonii]|nr:MULTISPECIES: hypothetical protein [Rhizobium]QIO63586.1 hypothetical protein HA462_00350 [Rhizobium leguminosarum bv. trifolii]MBB4504925.1 hypothetical protein [Rhizobium leguminosarum]MBY5339801.1 hypothetical protein [Rhizobium leguminosarum]MBY5372652.1 hypothetical protein [Rhizobium leguminosarum]MBY5414492.1 hypothetical protein [Rhizobium leguminosarum]
MTQGRPTGAGSDTPRSEFFAPLARMATTAALGGGLAVRNIPLGIAPARE